MITSSIPGRLRLRHASLRAPVAARAAQATASAIPGVRAAVANAAAGSLLVTYDPARVVEGDIVARLGLAEGAPREGASLVQPETPVRAIPACMTATLLVSLGAAALKLKWLHVTAGVAFVGCVAAHVIDRGQPKPHHHHRHRARTSPS